MQRSPPGWKTISQVIRPQRSPWMYCTFHISLTCHCTMHMNLYQATAYTCQVFATWFSKCFPCASTFVVWFPEWLTEGGFHICTFGNCTFSADILFWSLYTVSICSDCKLKLWKIKPFPHKAPSSELKQTPALYNSLQKLLIANFGLSQPSPAEPPPAPFRLVIPTNQVMPHTSTIRGPNRPICDLPSCHSSANLRHLPI